MEIKSDVTILNDKGEAIQTQEESIGQPNDSKYTNPEALGSTVVQKVKANLSQWLDWIDILYGGMCIVMREELPDKVGELVIPEEVREKSQMGASLGMILKISKRKPFLQGGFDEHAAYRLTQIKPGDVCMFDPNRPERIGKGFKTDMPHYPVQLIHIADLHTLWSGPYIFEDNEELKKIVDKERKKWDAEFESYFKSWFEGEQYA